VLASSHLIGLRLQVNESAIGAVQIAILFPDTQMTTYLTEFSSLINRLSADI